MILCGIRRMTVYSRLLDFAMRICDVNHLRKRLDLQNSHLTGPRTRRAGYRWVRLLQYVNDWHLTQRNYYFYGLDYQAIKESYPEEMQHFNGPGAPTSVMDPIPDYQFLLRTCLICKAHAERPRNQGWKDWYCI
jgi:hypothetical protein